MFYNDMYHTGIVDKLFGRRENYACVPYVTY